MEMAGKHVCPQTLSLTGRFGEPHHSRSLIGFAAPRRSGSIFKRYCGNKERQSQGIPRLGASKRSRRSHEISSFALSYCSFILQPRWNSILLLPLGISISSHLLLRDISNDCYISRKEHRVVCKCGLDAAISSWWAAKRSRPHRCWYQSRKKDHCYHFSHRLRRNPHYQKSASRTNMKRHRIHTL